MAIRYPLRRPEKQDPRLERGLERGRIPQRDERRPLFPFSLRETQDGYHEGVPWYEARASGLCLM